jgi:hypothetical protein
MGVIAFPGDRARAFRSADLAKTRQRSRKQRPRLKPQIERINALLEELEGLTGHSSGTPSAMLTRARAIVCQAEQKLGPHDVGHSTLPSQVEADGDPQPHVEREVLDRLLYSPEPRQ